ncbi:MAG: hypothetical protein AABX23_00595 [Nanoarchaeota archaeon]
MKPELTNLEGRVVRLVYSNSKESHASGLPRNFVSFSIRTGERKVKVLLTGKYVPHIQNGDYVEAMVEKVRFRDREIDDLRVIFMWGKESKGKEELWEYRD